MIVPKKRKPRNLLSIQTILAVLILLLISSSISFLIGKKGLAGPWQTVTTKLNFYKTTTYHKLFTPSPDEININISFKDLQKIENKRLEALEKGVLISEDQDFVSAEIDFQNKKIPVKLRLKGDWTDHLESDKWSFRIHTKDNYSFLGMRRFSIQDPATRGDANEWIFLQSLKHQGLITLRYQLISVSINGEDKGIFALEEHFGKELLENNQRREAPILKFSEDQFWANGLSYGFTPESSANLFYQSLVEPFQQNKILNDQQLLSQFQQAEYLLKQFRSGSLSSEKVFDLDQWATLFALSDVFGVRHGLVWHNLRFYLNPLTRLIEPIAFDSNPGEKITYLSLNAPPQDYELTSILGNKKFQERYIQKLEEFSNPQYLSSFLKVIKQDLERFEKIINREKPYSSPTNTYYSNQEFIKRKLTQTPALLAFTTQRNTMEVISTHTLPLVVNNQLLPSLGHLTIPLSNLSYHILGLNQEHQITPQPWITQVNDNGLPQSSPLPTFASIDQLNQRLIIPPGNWTLFRNLIVPQNLTLYIAPGTTINLLSKAYIISHSPVNLEGTSQNPIKIHSTDQTGQGIFVLNAPKKSNISYTLFNNLTNIQTPSTNITGSVTFYNSPVKIENTSFSNSNSEDALNLVNSDFEIFNTSFSNSSSDALDIDFSHGSIIGSTFKNSVNDAIDLSASTANILNTTINQAGDKGISVGEASLVTIEDTNIKNTYTGIASKDLSEINLKLVTIQDGKIGLASYQKKPEYGPGYISSWGSTLTNIKTPYLIETDSIIILNDNQQPANQKDVYKTFYAN